MIQAIRNWLGSGAEVQEGLRLLAIYAPNPHLHRLVSINPSQFKHLLVQVLSDKIPAITPSINRQSSFRENWSFLSDVDCPNELKVLASDKITAYWNYVDAHEKLFSCFTLEECFLTAKKIIENYIENRKIYSELAYYKEHHSLLGKHPIFDEMKRLAELRHLSIQELFRRKCNLEDAIWRIRSEIKKGDKPHLLITREQRLHRKQRELNEVQRIISTYATV